MKFGNRRHDKPGAGGSSLDGDFFRSNRTVRDLKSDREIGLMRKAGLIVWQAHQIAARLMVPGRSTAEIDAAVHAYFNKCDVRPLFLNHPNPARGKPPFPNVTCMSVNDQVVHGIPNHRPLREGDIVSIDTGCKLGGWCGDAAITHAIGQVAPEVRQLLDVTSAVLNLSIDLMHTKSFWSEVAEEMYAFVADHGFTTVECFVGHGIGRQMHQDPQVPNFVNRSLRGSGDFRIEPGLVIAIEPMVNAGTKKVKLLPDHWTQSTKDGKPSAHFEHTVAVTKDGCVRLTGPPTAEEFEEMSPLLLSREEVVRW